MLDVVWDICDCAGAREETKRMGGEGGVIVECLSMKFRVYPFAYVY